MDILEKHDNEKNIESNNSKGWPTMTIEDFIEKALVGYVGEKNSLPAFLQLLNDYDLCVRDGAINANSIDTTNLTKRLILNDDKEIPDLWEFLISEEEEHYSIHRNDVAEAFKKANKTEFPWLKINGEHSCLQCDDFAEINSHDASKPPGLPAMQSDFKEALNQDCWTAQEAIYWLHGRNPLWCRGSIEDYYQSEVTLVLNAITAKNNELTADKSSPIEWIQWAVSKNWELPDYISEFVLTGEQIDWRYRATMPNIKSCEAARLSLCIDPIKYPGNECFLGQLTDGVNNDLKKCERWLESHSDTWTLPQLVEILGDNRTPDGMKNAAIEWKPNKQVTESQTVKTKNLTKSPNYSQNDKKKVAVINKFASFKNLRSNQISLVMMEGGKAKVVINRKCIDIFPNDFRLKEKSQGWKLLEGAATANGDLQPALRALNQSSNREKETKKIRTAINRLNTKLKVSLGLQENPILFDAGNYRFTFKSMTHELISGLNVTKGADAMDYLSDEESDEVNSTQIFWEDSD